MKYRTSKLLFCLVAMAAAGSARSATSQAHPSKARDITGTWERYPKDWYGKDPDHPPLPGGPFDLRQPYAAAYAALKQKEAAADAAGKPLVNASSRCLPEGMPMIMGAIYPIQILQNPGQVTVLAEFLTQTRRIWLDEKMPAIGDIPPSYNGYSVAHWDGDGLIIETKGVREDVTFYDLPHSANMVIRERIKRSAPDRITDEVSIEDPEVLKTPYRFTFEYQKINYKIQEYICDYNQLKVDAEGGTSLDLNGVRK